MKKKKKKKKKKVKRMERKKEDEVGVRFEDGMKALVVVMTTSWTPNSSLRHK